MSTFHVRRYLAAASLVVVSAAPAFATGIPAGSVTGVFSNPILTGDTFDPSLNQFVHLDNSTTAVYAGFVSNDITWGADPSFSELRFVGENFPAMSGGTRFLLG